MSRVAVVLGAVLVACASVTGQQRDPASLARLSPVGTALISGTVLADGNPPTPMRRAVVTLTETANAIASRYATTDDEGRFMFDGLPTGHYTLRASRPPSLNTAYGARRVTGPNTIPTGTTLTIANGAQVTGLTMVMVKGAAIEGTIRDADGQPARGLVVYTLYSQRSAEPAGERVLAGAWQTDDRGAYRIYGLAPGEYFVVATPSSWPGELMSLSDAELARALDLVQRPITAQGTGALPESQPTDKPATVGFVPVYYPGTADVVAAAAIRLSIGEERSGVDFQMRLVTISRIEGTVTGPDGAAAVRANIQAVPSGARRGPVLESMFVYANADAQGRFVLSGLPPGAFTLLARAPGTPPSPPVWGTADVVMQGHDATVNLTLQLAPVVTGRIVFDGTSTPPEASKMRIMLASMSPYLPSGGATVQPSGEFTISGMPPGHYGFSAFNTITAPESPWFAKSAIVAGQNVIDGFVDIRPGETINGAVVTFTDRVTQLSGTLTDGTNRPAPDYFIVVFPANPSDWIATSRRIVQTRPSSDGTYTIRNLPPGDYRIAAVTDLQQNEWVDPAFLSQLVDASIKLTIGENAKVIQNMQIR